VGDGVADAEGGAAEVVGGRGRFLRLVAGVAVAAADVLGAAAVDLHLLLLSLSRARARFPPLAFIIPPVASSAFVLRGYLNKQLGLLAGFEDARVGKGGGLGDRRGNAR